MQCPLCKINLKEAILCNIGVDYCPQCLGLWFEKDELRWAKDEKDKNLNWLDIDLWQDKTKFIISPGQLLCPLCRLPLYQVEYGQSGIKVDLCNVCEGIWLDRGEFKKIIEYLKEKADWEVLHNWTKNLLQEALEIFVGPESFREELSDFLTILGLFKFKFAAQHPQITQLISKLPK